MRIFKAFGLALVAVTALAAITASAASANQFHSASTNTTLTVSSNATQLFQYETGGPTVECSTVGGSGQTANQTVSEVTFKPTYSGCEITQIFGSKAEVSMNECDYKFTIEAGANKGPVHVECEGTSQIQITVRVFGIDICTLRIGAQTPSGNADYANNGTAQIDVTPTQTGISGTRTGSEECGKASSSTGSYSGRVQVKGEITGQTTATNVQVG